MIILSGVLLITLIGCSYDDQSHKSEEKVCIDELVNKDINHAWNFKDADPIIQQFSDSHKELLIGVSIHERTNKIACISIYVPLSDLPGVTEKEKINELQKMINPQDVVKKTPAGEYYSSKGMYQQFNSKKFGRVVLYGTNEYNWILRNWESGDTYHSARYNWRDGITGAP